MFKVITNGESLEGKVIKYCNISHGTDAYEYNIICTEDNELMIFIVNDNNTIICYNEQKIKSAICTWSQLENELLEENIITEKEVKVLKNEIKEKNKIKDEKMKKQRYEEYLKLKKEFEPEI